MDTNPPPVLAPKNEVYATFCSGIDQASIQRIMQGVAIASQNKVTHIHLLFQSNGGSVNDGICLYNFFRACPVELSIYNVGAVQSIGLIAYLGAKHRITQKHALFMMHRTTSPALAVGIARLKSITDEVTLDDARTEQILREHSKISADNWANLRDNEFWFSAADAVKSGIADVIGEFSPVACSPIFNL